MVTEPRTPSDLFAFICAGRIEHGKQLTLTFSGDIHIPYPRGYAFPLPGPGAVIVGPNSSLRPFVRFEAIDQSEAKAGRLCHSLRGWQLASRAASLQCGRFDFDRAKARFQFGRSPLNTAIKACVETTRGGETLIEMTCIVERWLGRSFDIDVWLARSDKTGRRIAVGSRSGFGFDIDGCAITVQQTSETPI